jgi:hypothetical protein
MPAHEDYQPGDIVWYRLSHRIDETFAGVWHSKEVVAVVVRVTAKRVVIKPHFDGLAHGQADPARAVSRDKVRPI